MKKILLFLSFLLMSIGVLGETTTFTFSDIASSNSWINGSAYTPVSISPITIYGNGGGNNAKYYTSDKTWRMYNGGTVNIVVTSGYTITAVSSNPSQTFIISNDTATLSCTATIKFKSITVTYSNSQQTTYTVTYKANGGIGTMTDSISSYNSGSTVTVLENSFTREGYTFTNWNTQSDGGGTGYAVGDTFTINANTTLYAQWEDEVTPTPPTPPTPGENVLFHESFGENNGEARTWNDSYSVKTGIESVYEGIDEYVIGNAKQSKSLSKDGKPMGKVLSALSQTTSGTDAYIIIGPLNVENYNNLVLDYWWKAGSTKGEYFTSLYYATSDIGPYIEVLGTGTGASTFINRVYHLPSSAEISTLYIKIVWNTSNTQGYIDEVNLTGTDCSNEYEIVWENNGEIYASGNPPTTFNPCIGIETVPYIPTDTIICADEFIGWSEDDITGNHPDEPNNLFNTPVEFNRLYKNVDGNRYFHAVYASLTGNSNNENLTTAFTSEYWEDENDNWANIQNGFGFDNEKGVSITKGTPIAETKTKYLYRDISSIEIECTGTNGTIDIQIGQNSVSSQTTVSGKVTFNFTPYQTGQVDMTVRLINTTGNSVQSVYIKSITISHVAYEYKDYETYCTDTLKSGGMWSTGKWSLGHIPEHNERAVILEPVTVDIPHARAKEVILGPNGKLTIAANKGLKVKDTISVHDGTFSATTADKLVLNSSEDGNASLIFNNNNESQATVCLYSIASIDREKPQWNWQYMGTAMTELNALYNYYGSWIYRWDKNDGWVVVPNGGIMNAWTGYCITQENPEWYSTTGTLVPTDGNDVILEVPANSNMVFANSWTAPIHVSKFTDETFDLDTKNVYLFNTGSDTAGTGAIVENGNEPGTYIVMPIYSSPYTGDSLIAPQQGFYVKTGNNAGTVTLKYNEVVRTNRLSSIVAGAMRAPKRGNLNDKPDIMKIYAKGSKYTDKVVILERSDFSNGFDNGWDGDKLSFGSESPSVYITNEDGTYDAVSAVPDYEGTIVGFRPCSDSTYTLSFDYGGGNMWYLNDMSAHLSTLIQTDNEYSFTSDSTNGDFRFIISSTPYSGVTTDISNVGDKSAKVKKYLYDGTIYIVQNNHIFNVIGKLIQ